MTNFEKYRYGKQTGRGSVDLNVLTYNISWEAMEGNKIGKVDLAPICLQGSENICLNNITKFIIGFNALLPFDLIGLQEASNWEIIYAKIKKEIPHLKPIDHGLSIEYQVIFYDSHKYQLQTGVSVIKSYLAGQDRPLMIVFLCSKDRQNDFCVINMHPGHRGDFNELQTHLQQTFYGKKKGAVYSTDGTHFSKFPTDVDTMTDIMIKLQNNHIIMMGDMNFKPSDPYVFLPQFVPEGRILHGVSNSYTCCDPHLRGNVHLAYDHVMASTKYITHVVHQVNRASDHLPVIAQIHF